MRTIKIISNTTHKKIEVNTNASTWGELCEQNSDVADMSAGLKVVEKSSKAVLEAGTGLPPGDCTIYLFPSKIEAGI